MISSGTPKTPVFTLLAYDVTDPRKYADDPAMDVISAEIVPHVQDSAVARVLPFSANMRPMQLSRVSSISE